MKPAIVMPMHDPTGVMFHYLKIIFPDLKDLFARAYLSVPKETYQFQAVVVDQVRADHFFNVLIHEESCTVGEDFYRLYELASENSPEDQVLHLCFIDRLAFALQSEHRGAYLADLQKLDDSMLPLVFQRSEWAWGTHPENYRVFEKMVVDTGAFLFGKRLDYAWCYLVLRAAHLRAVLPYVSHKGISLIAEILLRLRNIVQTKDVDWLAWEDPFITRQDPALLKQAREKSTAEVVKRLDYVLPMLELLKSTAQVEDVYTNRSKEIND